MKKTIQELTAELKVLSDASDERNLTDDELAQVRSLKDEIERTRQTEEVRSLYQAYITPNASLQAPTQKRDDTLSRAFTDYLRDPEKRGAEFRAQSEAVGSQGGYLVPDEYLNDLVRRLKAFGGIRNAARVITTDDGRNYNYPTVSDVDNVGTIVQEGDTFSSGADITLGTRQLTAYSYMAGGNGDPIRVSYELAQDAAFDVAGFVGDLLAERIARIQSHHLVNGTGAGQPEGVLHGVTGVEIADDTKGIQYDDLITFIHSVDPAYRNGAVWAFNDQSLARIKKIKDSHGDPIWRPADANMATETGGGVLLGYPVFVDQAFPDFVANSNTVNWGVFGNLHEGFTIRDVRGIEILSNPYSRMSNRQVEYSAWARMDSCIRNPYAYVGLTGEV